MQVISSDRSADLASFQPMCRRSRATQKVGGKVCFFFLPFYSTMYWGMGYGVWGGNRAGPVAGNTLVVVMVY